RLSRLIREEKFVAHRIARGIEEAGAAVDVAPALEDDALGVRADEEITLKSLVRNIGNPGRPRHMPLAGMVELELRAFFFAIGATDEKHWGLSMSSARRRQRPPRRSAAPSGSAPA